LRIALVAATIDEARAVMVEGASGLLACARPEEIAEWSPTRRELVFASGARAVLFSGANPEALRGPQHHFAWCDELAKWRHPERTWDMLQLGLRCGARPRALVTTTPRGGCAALGRILAAPDTVLSGGRTGDNPHLPEAFLAAVESAYGGTRLGRQEIDGELLADVAGSLWPAALLERCRGAAPGEDALRRVVVGVDPPASAGGTCGIVVCALDAEGVGHVLADRSAGGLSPEGWARAVAAAAEAYAADRIVAEKNQGGDMVGAVLRSAGIALPIALVSATRGKAARAEPVAGLFEAGKARLAGRFPELEAQLAGLVAGGGYEGPGPSTGSGQAKSPDRADAMVWALWALLVARKAEPRVHRM
jgi:phage terminase large subunit-like protein